MTYLLTLRNLTLGVIFKVKCIFNVTEHLMCRNSLFWVVEMNLQLLAYKKPYVIYFMRYTNLTLGLFSRSDVTLRSQSNSV